MNNECGEAYGEGIPFERIRRITGYLVGDYRRMNNAKQSEVKEREKHNEDIFDNTNNNNIWLDSRNNRSNNAQ